MQYPSTGSKGSPAATRQKKLSRYITLPEAHMPHHQRLQRALLLPPTPGPEYESGVDDVRGPCLSVEYLLISCAEVPNAWLRVHRRSIDHRLYASAGLWPCQLHWGARFRSAIWREPTQNGATRRRMARQPLRTHLSGSQISIPDQRICRVTALMAA